MKEKQIKQPNSTRDKEVDSEHIRNQMQIEQKNMGSPAAAEAKNIQVGIQDERHNTPSDELNLDDDDDQTQTLPSLPQSSKAKKMGTEEKLPEDVKEE